MSYFPGVFITQFHKSRAGYYINHDLLMSASPQSRNKLIFYFIAQNTPQKLNPSDSAEYQAEKSSRLTNSITFWSYFTFLGIVLPTTFWVFKQRRATAFRDILLGFLAGGYTSTVVNSTLWRTNEARMLQSSEVIERLADKYKFGIYDFSLAKKEAHVQKLLEVYDVQREFVHDS